MVLVVVLVKSSIVFIAFWTKWTKKMYEPAKRLRSFVSSTESAASSPTAKPKRAKPTKKPGDLFAHIVTFCDMREELNHRTSGLSEIIEALDVGQSYEMRTTMKTGAMAERTCDKIASGTSFAYVAMDLPKCPACLAIGKTTGCRVEGTTVIATWEIAKKTCLNGFDNPWTLEKLGKLRSAFFRKVKPSEPLYSAFFG